ncbi:MAG: Ig-like domain-containing protein, partial [Gammaproteobacteria bacterium]|nr:Ig-like domain-containing protein [Gammaproteobacteria bacterium]
AVTLTANPDYEHKNHYSFSVVASDAAGNKATQTLRLNINDVDETADTTAPVFTSGSTATAIDENSGAGQVIYTAVAKDDVGIARYELSGTDASAFSIDSTTGAVTLTANPDYEHKNHYSFSVVASDAAGNKATQTLRLNINDLDDTPPTLNTQASAILGESSNLVLEFSENIKVGTGNIEIWTIYGKSAFKIIAVDDNSQIKITDDKLTINPTDDLDAEEYYLKMDAGVVTDSVGNATAAVTKKTSWAFETKKLSSTFVIEGDTNNDAIINAAEKSNLALSGVIVSAGTSVAVKVELIKTGGATVTIYLAVDSNKAWSIAKTNTQLTDLTDGEYTFRLTVTENGSSVINQKAISIDTNIPNAPSALDLASADDSGYSHTDNITNKATDLTITGTAEANTTVELFNGVTSLGTVTVNTGGRFRKDIHASIFGGATVINLTAKATDAAGNESAASTVLPITIDIITPTLTVQPNAVLGEASNLVLDFSENIIAGRGNIEIWQNRGTRAFKTIDINDAQITISNDKLVINPMDNLAKGEYYLKMDAGVVTDIAGNEVAAIANKTTWAFETTEPYSTLVIAGDANSDAIINVTEKADLALFGVVSSKGSGPFHGASIKVELIKTDGATVVINPVVESNKTWLIAKTDARLIGLTDGEYTIKVTATERGFSTVNQKVIIIDTLSPTDPVINTVATDDVINFAEKNTVITGTTEAGTTVMLSIAGNDRMVTVKGTTWSYSLVDADITAMGQGVESIIATATDVAGNTAVSAAKSIFVGTNIPNAPSALDLASADDSGYSHTDNITNKATDLTITGTAEANTTVELFNGVTSLGTVTVNTGGRFRKDIHASIFGGATVINLTAKATDAAGNESAASTVLPITIDIITPTLTVQPNAVLGEASNLVLDFSENIIAGRGNIEIWQNRGTRAFKTIDINDAQITISNDKLVINPMDNLAKGEYYLKMDAGVVTDIAGNEVAAIANKTTWAFETTEPYSTLVIAGDANSDAIINVTEKADLALFGVVSSKGSGPFHGASIKVELIKTDGATVVINPVVESNKTWLIAKTDARLIGLTDGEYTIKVTATERGFSTVNQKVIIIDTFGSTTLAMDTGSAGNDDITDNNQVNVTGGSSSWNAGDDTIIINADNLANLLSNNLLAQVDGGGGDDTLQLSGSGLLLDLTTLNNSRIKDIENIDLTGSGDNTLKLNLDDLLDISSSSNILKVFGDSGDKVDIDTSKFTTLSIANEAGVTYDIYTHADASSDAAAALWIDVDLTVI